MSREVVARGRVVRNDAALSRATADGVLVVLATAPTIDARAEAHKLVGGGPLLWELLATPHTVDEIVMHLEQRVIAADPAHDADLAALAASVEATLDALRADGLVVEVP